MDTTDLWIKTDWEDVLDMDFRFSGSNGYLDLCFRKNQRSTIINNVGLRLVKLKLILWKDGCLWRFSICALGSTGKR